VSFALVVWFLLSILCDVAGQLCLKRGAVTMTGAAGGAAVAALLRSRWALAGIAIYALELAIWLRILAEVPLSIAFPIASTNFLGVALASAVVLGERVGPRQWAGAALITCGVIVVAQAA